MPQNRLRWGCDREATEGYGIPCAACDGRGIGCKTCSGRGQEVMRRCPQWYMTRPGVRATMAAWSWLKAHKVLPVTGGSMEQTACFQQAVAVLNAAQAAHQQREAQKRG